MTAGLLLSPHTESRADRVALAAVLLAAVVVAYIPALRGDFIWDDDRHVSENRTLRTADGLRRIWFEPRSIVQYYPLTHTTFWLEYRLWGLNPVGYHVTNVLLHGINAILVWLVLRKLNVPGAYLAAAIFALHPIQVESVAWISERKNVLSMMFFLASILAYLRLDFAGYVLALLLFACAVFSKTITVSMPAVILLLLWWKGKLTRKEILLLIPFFVIGVLMARITVRQELFHVGAVGPDWELDFVERFLIAGRAVWFYVGKTLWPVNLMFSYPRWTIDPSDVRQWLPPVALIAVLSMLAVGHRRFGRGPLAAALIYVGTLFPALGFINTYPMRYSFVADHFQYLSSPALIGPIVAVLAEGWRRWGMARDSFVGASRVVVAPTVVLLVVLGMLSWRQAGIYRDVETLWRDTIAKNPHSWMARNNLGATLLARADRSIAAGRTTDATVKLEEAAHLFVEVLRLNPQHPMAVLLLAETKVRLKRYDEALALFEAELERDPNNVHIINRMGAVLWLAGKPAPAERRFRQAMTLDPTFVEAKLNLARFFEQQGDLHAAAVQYREVLAEHPNEAAAHRELGLLLCRTELHDLEGAAEHLARYVELAPGDARTRASLGFVYGELGRLGDAERQFRVALQLDPRLPQAHEGMRLLRGLEPAGSARN